MPMGIVFATLEGGSGDTLSPKRDRDEMTFVASQCVLGCCVYPTLVGFWVGITTENADLGLCCCMTTPLAVLGTSSFIALNRPIRKPMGVATFSWTLNGLVWSALAYSNLVAWTESPELADPKITSTALLFGTSAGNTVGYFMGASGYGSEGSHVLSLFATFQGPYYYFQLKRLVFGTFYANWERGITFAKVDLTLSSMAGVGASLLAFNVTKDWKDFTGGDGIFMGANVVKGSVAFSAPVRSLAVATCGGQAGEEDIWTGTVFMDAYTCNGRENTLLTRLSSLAQIGGAFAGIYISHRIIKEEDFNLVEGLVYGVVPILAYYAAAAPLILFRNDPNTAHAYYTVMPLVQVGLDLGTSYMLYKLFTKRF